MSTASLNMPSKLLNVISRPHFEVVRREGGSVGTLYLEDVPTAGSMIYVDIEYCAESSERGSIQWTCASFTSSCHVLPGGLRSFSLAVPRADVETCPEICFESSVPLSLKTLHVRRRYDDYFGLRSSAASAGSKTAERTALEIANSIPLSIQWFVTWKCNFSCAYCWQEVAAEEYRRGRANRIDPEKWAACFNRLGPREMSLTGGEPSLYRRLPEFIALLQRDIQLVMHSNLGVTFDVDRFHQHVPCDRFRELTFSLHPTQIGVEEFLERFGHLIAVGYQNLMAEMVLYPQNIPAASEVLRRCRELGVSLRFDPYVPSANNPVGRDEASMAQMKDWIAQAEEHTRSLGQIKPWSFEKPQYWDGNVTNGDQQFQPARPSRHPVYCAAGSKRINVDDVGDVYVCMSAIDRSKIFDRHALPHYAPIGNVFDENFKLLKRPLICWESFRCSACDFQVLDRAWRPAATERQSLPLPE